MRKTLTALAAGLLLATPAIATPAADLTALADAITQTMRAHHYNPEELDGPEYAETEAAILALGETADSQEAFLEGFEAIFESAPFSHVALRPAQAPAAEMAAFFDNFRVGGGGAVLTWQDATAILTVNTMMGVDTIEEIDAAYLEIATQNAETLIIDLRNNSGGAFAVKPLVENVIAEPLEAGMFVSQPWNAEHDRAPTLADAQAYEPWQGWSIIAFWDSVQSDAITRLRFEPVTHAFEGNVYVLVGPRTGSAAELAADALKASGRAILIGETTAGEMLSQTMFDMPGGLHLSLPIADYFSVAHGRIEGHGVEPHVRVSADAAMDEALSRIP